MCYVYIGRTYTRDACHVRSAHREVIWSTMVADFAWNVLLYRRGKCFFSFVTVLSLNFYFQVWFWRCYPSWWRCWRSSVNAMDRDQGDFKAGGHILTSKDSWANLFPYSLTVPPHRRPLEAQPLTTDYSLHLPSPLSWFQHASWENMIYSNLLVSCLLNPRVDSVKFTRDWLHNNLQWCLCVRT